MLPSDSDKNQLGQLALRTLADDTLFIRAVTDYAGTHEVSVSDDIHASNGIKLVAKGTRLSGKFVERLLAHKLLKPIEQSLSIDDALDAPQIVALALASIFHDIGETCIGPGMLLPAHRLSEDERLHLYIHPITGYLMLRDFSEISAETAIAVRAPRRQRLSLPPCRCRDRHRLPSARRVRVLRLTASALRRRSPRCGSTAIATTPTPWASCTNCSATPPIRPLSGPRKRG